MPGNSSQINLMPSQGAPAVPTTAPAIQPIPDNAPKAGRPVLSKGWWIGGILLLIVLLALTGYTYYSQPQNNSSQNNQPKDDRSFGVTPTPSPTAMPSASPSATPADTSKINLMPMNAKTVTLTPQVQGAAYDSAKVAVNSTTSQVRQDFANGDAKALYTILSSDLHAMFTEADLAAALKGVGNIDLQPANDPIIATDWAKQTVSYTHNGSTTTYDVILHKENGQWKLYGTVQSK